MNTYYPLLVPLAPLLAALATALPVRGVSQQRYKLAWWGFVIGFLISVGVLIDVAMSDHGLRMKLFDSPWHFLPEVTLTIDRLAAIMMVLISGIGTLLYRYSIRYLQQDPAQPRYHTLLALCISSLLFMVTSSDLITLFIMWQLLSWLLCLLAHNYTHKPTAQSSFRTFVMLRLGDVAFLAGIILAYQLYGTLDMSTLFSRAAADTTMLSLGMGLEIRGATAVALLIFVGAMSKSAQFPLHMWLPDSLYAPTPIHGLLHAGIINAGGFLLNRLAPLYALSTPTLHFVFAVGLATTLLGTAMMLVQNDIKKTLGYSTIGQMGFMIMECGLGAFSLAVFHLAAHGLFKATIFLNCGDVIRQARVEPHLPPKPVTGAGPSAVSWVLGFITSLAVPLAILVAVHELLGIDYQDEEGLTIFLFFSWVTASQAVMTLSRVKASGPVSQSVLVAVGGISAAYLFGAEMFTIFLYEDPKIVGDYFHAASFPNWFFYTGVAISVVLIALAWAAVFRQRRGASLRPSELRTRLYLFFSNRLYMDGLALRLHGGLKRALQAFDRSSYIGLAVVAAATGGIAAVEMSGSFSGDVAPVLAAGLLLPLFPLHGVYVNAVTRAPKALGVLVAILMPLAGLCVLMATMMKVPRGMLPALQVLALGGAVYGTLKALVQPRAAQVLAYGGVAVYSLGWWHIASVGGVSPQAFVFTASAALALGGLTLAWTLIRARFGDLPIMQISGLFRPMPRLSLCFALLVMVAAGLPPFGLFFGYLGMLTAMPVTLSVSLFIACFAWFATSWYLFRLLQRLVMGPARSDFLYDDIRGGELMVFFVLIAASVTLGVMPHEWSQSIVFELTSAFGGMR